MLRAERIIKPETGPEPPQGVAGSVSRHLLVGVERRVIGNPSHALQSDLQLT